MTRKITHTLAVIAKGSSEVLELGNLSAECDWSFAGDIAEGMRLSLQHDVADTYVLRLDMCTRCENLWKSQHGFLVWGFHGKEAARTKLGLMEKGARLFVLTHPLCVLNQCIRAVEI